MTTTINFTVDENLLQTYKYSFSTLALDLNWKKMDSKKILWTIVVGFAFTAVLAVAQLPVQFNTNSKPSNNLRSGALTSTREAWNQINGKSKSIFEEPSFQLTDNLIPVEYKLEVIPILKDNVPSGQKEFTAPGAVRIKVICNTSTKRISLHSNNTEIHEISVIDEATSIAVLVGSPIFQKDMEVVHFDVTTGELVKGKKYVITIKHTAQIPLGLLGLYRAEYKDENGNTKWFAATQFATIGFRQMAPGFDDPKFKAKFTISICRTREQNSLSNTVIDKDATDADLILDTPTNWVWDHYKPTVVMSTYLLAMVISEYVCTTDDGSNYRIPVRVCGPPKMIEAPRNGGDFAAFISPKLLKAYDSIFGPGLEYPLEKMDTVAIPGEYFQWGAMENWGIVTFDDRRFMYYAGESTESERFGIANIISHEFAHQWFGDLVTCDWWSHVWLNEGFATYWANIGVSKTLLEYEAREQFLYTSFQLALREDAGPKSHPVINEGTKNNVITMDIFDAISYQKGGSLLRMMEGFLGEETLFEGIKLYLSQQQYKTAVQDDLFKYLGTVAKPKLPEGVTLKEIMDTWTLQKGFPLVRVSVASEDKIFISQEPFINNYHASAKSKNLLLDPNDLWEVPISIATEDSPNFANHSAATWLKKTIALDSLSHNTSKWIVVNPEAYGFYRVLYDTNLTTLIQNQLEKDHTVITALSKGQLIDDYFTLAEQGYTQIENALAMTKFLATESSHIVWNPVLTSFTRLRQRFGSHPTALNALKRYLAPKIEGALNTLKWTQDIDEHGIQVIIRASLLDWACSLEHPKCYETATAYFDEWVAKNKPIPTDLQSTVYCAVVAGGNEARFQAVLSAFRSQRGDVEIAINQTTRLLAGLTCAKNIENSLWLISNSLAPEFKEYTNLILQGLVKNIASRDLAIGFVRDNWQRIVQSSGSHQIIATTISSASVYQSLNSDLTNHEALIDDIKLKDVDIFTKLSSTFEDVTKAIKTNQAWVASNLSPVQNWLEDNSV